MEFNVEIPYPGIYIYRGAFPDPLGFIENSRDNKTWQKWYTFGERADIESGSGLWRAFPNSAEWKTAVLDRSTTPEFKMVNSLFYEVTKHYVESTGIEFPNWAYTPPALCKYEPKSAVTDDLVMHYHTDYQQEREEMPGYKFGITCTMYLNDDYEGGDISFRIYDGEVYDQIDIKPRQGDIVVFPSGKPYYHGVKIVHGQPKYFLRTFWYWDFEGTAEWHANSKKYGADAWAEIEKERWKEGFRSGLYTADNKGTRRISKSL